MVLLAGDAFVSVANVNRLRSGDSCLRSQGIRRHADASEEDFDGEVDDGGDNADPKWKDNKKNFLREYLLEVRFKEGPRSTYEYYKAKDDYMNSEKFSEEKKEILKKTIPLPLDGDVEDESRVTTKKDGLFRFKPEMFKKLFEGERMTEMVDGRFRFLQAA